MLVERLELSTPCLTVMKMRLELTSSFIGCISYTTPSRQVLYRLSYTGINTRDIVVMDSCLKPLGYILQRKTFGFEPKNGSLASNILSELLLVSTL